MSSSTKLLDTLEPTLQVVSFRLDEEIYALDILLVQEIIKSLPVTQVPLTASWIEGVINLRGQIIPLINLPERLNLKRTPYNKDTRFVIVRSDEQYVGLVVDEVLEVLRLYPGSLEQVPNTTIDKEYIQGVSKFTQGLVIILDLPKVLYEHQASSSQEAP